MHGKENYYKYFSDLMSKSLQPALDDQKRLYDCGMVDQYLTLSVCYSDEDALRAEQRCVGWPTYLVFTVHCREDEVQDDKIPEELRSQRIQLKIKLMNRYDVSEATAKELSSHLFLGMLGDFVVWFERKEKYVAERIRLHQPMKKAAYIVSALRGFFKDRGSLPVKSSGASSPDPVPVAKPFPPVPSNLKND